jgi:hypothetical protein
MIAVAIATVDAPSTLPPHHRHDGEHRMTVYFPDTNFFLECRKASDLPWDELTSATHGTTPEIRLIVPSTVITEIERHKAKGNSRTAKRARETSAVLRKALNSPGHITDLRAANPRVILELPPVVKVDFSQLPDLDPTRPDHRIAAEYVEVLKAQPELAVLTDDTLLALAVRSLGFEPVLIPDSWKLAPEKDERDDQIDRLKDELRTYKQKSPDLAIAIIHAGGDAAIIDATIDVFDPSDDEIQEALACAQKRFPMEEDFHSTPPNDASSIAGRLMTFGQIWQAPRADEIEDYKSERYPKWVASVRNKLTSLAARLNEISQEIPFFVRISNTGFANASDVRLTITAYDGILLLDSLSEKAKANREQALSLPMPPEPPCGKYASAFSPVFGALMSSNGLRDIIQPPYSLPPRDSNDFYYVGGAPRSPTEEIELTCEAFPHQSDPYNLSFRAVIPNTDLGTQPRLRIRLRASNQSKPIEKFVPVQTTFVRGDFPRRASDIARETGKAAD